ncbi:MAG: SIR2 family NAD-dependent protein deacylase [Thermoguttaceae bacterium]
MLGLPGQVRAPDVCFSSWERFSKRRLPRLRMTFAQERDRLAQAAQWLRQAREVVVFTGAGASAESGIPTFRDEAGFWQEFPPEEFAHWVGLTMAAIVRPRRLAEFLCAVLEPIAAAEPNPGHRAIAAMEDHTRVTVVTQNIDGLHQEAGSRCVLEVHGSLLEIITRGGRPLWRLSRAELQRIAARLARARRGWLTLPRLLVALRGLVGVGLRGLYRPSVVLFGDPMAEPAWTRAQEACRRCDLMIQVGCSLAVWPAAMLPQAARDAAKAHKARVIAVGPAPAEADLWLQGTAAQRLPELVGAAFGSP